MNPTTDLGLRLQMRLGYVAALQKFDLLDLHGQTMPRQLQPPRSKVIMLMDGYMSKPAEPSVACLWHFEAARLVVDRHQLPVHQSLPTGHCISKDGTSEPATLPLLSTLKSSSMSSLSLAYKFRRDTLV